MKLYDDGLYVGGLAVFIDDGKSPDEYAKVIDGQVIRLMETLTHVEAYCQYIDSWMHYSPIPGQWWRIKIEEGNECLAHERTLRPLPPLELREKERHAAA